MKNQKLFDRTIRILVNAYLNGTLLHTNCHACAVGNLVAANCGYKYKPNESREDKDDDDFKLIWEHKDRYTLFDTWYSGITKSENSLTKNESLEIESTGYSLNDLILIEGSFEGIEMIGWDNQSLENQFNGLMAVCDTLMQIHKASAEEITKAKR